MGAGEGIPLLPGLPVPGGGLDLERLLGRQTQHRVEPRGERLPGRSIADPEWLGRFERGVLGSEQGPDWRSGDLVDLGRLRIDGRLTR